MNTSHYPSLEWKKIPWFPEKYEINQFGNVRCINYKRLGIVQELSVMKNTKWYMYVSLSVSWKRKSVTVHKLMWLTFLEYKEWLVINHKDGDKTNNNISNLEYVTPSENNFHSIRTWLRKQVSLFGGKNKSSKKILQTTIWWYIIREWDCAMDIERELWIWHNNIAKVCKWKMKQTGGFKFSYL